jgi:hypothetical protein
VIRPTLTITHRRLESTVSCSCGFFSRTYTTTSRSRFYSYADSKAMGVALRHSRQAHDRKVHLQEVVEP